MRLSTLAALMILTTIMLSACSQESLAQLEDKGNFYYGRDAARSTYAAANPASGSPNTFYQDSANSTYANDARVSAVESADLAPLPSKSGQTVIPVAATPAAAAPEAGIALRWQWPIAGRVDYQQMKNGLVIEAPEGTPIYAAADGEVVFDGMDAVGFGRVAILRHADGSMTSYAHAQEILVSKGDKVDQGDLIGYVGRTGDATSPQLHFGMKRQGHAVNPMDVLPQQVAAL
ncbi:MAG: M23 family metallopeptidase [Alphaproteobacteria bacterium]|jgi:murein DD-endopeptidase MepM/ murein hydrolase activator NlpD